MAEFVSVGQDCFVRRSEIVAVHHGPMFNPDARHMAVEPWEAHVKCVIQLRDGHLFPCYVTAKTLMQRLEEASSDA